MKADYRKKILKASQELFAAHGYSKVSMDQLAKKLGMSKKTLYNYFSSKEQLLIEAIEDFRVRLVSEVEAVLCDSKKEFMVRLKEVFSMVGTTLSSLNPVFIEDVMRSVPVAWDKMQDMKREAAFRRFRLLLDEGIEKGHFNKNLNKTLAVMLYASAIETILNPGFTQQVPTEMIRELPYTADAIFDGLITILLEGLIVR